MSAVDIMIGTSSARAVDLRRHVLFLKADGAPDPCARRALGLFPLVFEQDVEIAHVPARRGRGPCAFEARRDGVDALAALPARQPAEAHRLDRRGFGLRTDMAGRAGAMRLAEGVAAGGERHRLVVVHGHAGEGLADVAARGDRVRIAVRSFRVHVDQAHLHRGKRVLEIALARIAAVGLVAGRQPLGLGAPVDVLLRLPGIGAAAAEAEGLEAHRFQRDVAGEHDQVGPGKPVAVFLLDRPQEPARLVEVAVVRPRIERRETLLAAAGAAAPVAGAVGARRVPGHADEQPAVMSVVGRPPLLRFGHQRREVPLHGRQVELLEFGRVVERRAHGVGQGRVLVKDPEVELVRPPVAVRAHSHARRSVHDRAFAGLVDLRVHISL